MKFMIEYIYILAKLFLQKQKLISDLRTFKEYVQAEKHSKLNNCKDDMTVNANAV